MGSLTIATHNQQLSIWIQRIRKCKESDHTVVAWCAENNISLKSYYYWRRKIKREAFEIFLQERKLPVLSAVSPDIVFTEISKHSIALTSGNAVILRIGETTVELQNGADAVTIENVLRILHTLC